MRVHVPVLLACLLVATALAGCSGDGGDGTDDGLGANVGKVGATSTTGGIRGVVVDASITPVTGARVAVGNGPETTTDKGGAFVFSNLAPGAYFLTITKPGFATMQQAAQVEAGVAEPPVLKVVIERLVGQTPFVEHYRLDGFYECGFALPVITDQCDFGVRTVHDEANGTAPVYPLPRNVQQGANTMFIDVPATVSAVVQEGFWTDPAVAAMKISLDETPIDNACDCSDSYIEVSAPSPTYDRLDKGDKIQGQTAAARGFLPFTDTDPANPGGTAATALNFEFVIITSLFHHHVPPAEWTFETRAQYPLE